MKRSFRTFCALLLTLIVAFSFACPASADTSNVIYDGAAREFIFQPGTDYSPTDLFPDFKEAMPGDTLGQKIAVRNDADKNVDVKIYMRALGAHEDSAQFLSQLSLSVASTTNDSLFQGTAAEKDGLADWVLLGTFKSGEEVELMATLQVPITLDNTYQEAIGYLDWEFKVEEFPIETPDTGDSTNVLPFVGIAVVALIVIIVLLVKRRKDTK
ncbi:MAG: LPXTG cell wall anchor domain-containing protein [Candidatus Fimisoma sp.]